MTKKGLFSALVYFEAMEFPVRAEVEYTEQEAESIRRALAEHNTEEDFPDMYDLAPSLAIKMRQAFLEQCPEEFLFNADALQFDYLEFPQEF